MGKNNILFYFFFFLFGSLGAVDVDVIIPCAEKDREILEVCIDQARKYVCGVRRIVVISSEKYTDKGEWSREEDFPFRKEDVGDQIFGTSHERVGWYYQQLLKLYAPLVIDNLSEYVLILDADTLFLSPYEPFDEKGIPKFLAFDTSLIHRSYLNHTLKMFPSLSLTPMVNPVINTMPWRKGVVESLHQEIEDREGSPFWLAFCRAVDNRPHQFSKRSIYVGASEYTLYFFYHTNSYPYDLYYPVMHNQATSMEGLDLYQRRGYELISVHHYRRKVDNQ